jgi:hypothetical protein
MRLDGGPGNEEVSGQVAMIFRFGGLTVSEVEYEWMAFESFVGDVLDPSMDGRG